MKITGKIIEYHQRAQMEHDPLGFAKMVRRSELIVEVDNSGPPHLLNLNRPVTITQEDE